MCHSVVIKFTVRILCIVCISVLPAFARPADNFTARTHSYNGTALPYRLLEPYGYDAGKDYPLVLALHGAGERGTDNWRHIIYNGLAEVWAESTCQTENPCFVVAPQCPSGQQWVDVNWGGGTYDFNSVTISNELETVNDLLDSMITEYSVDINRIYITGLSMGGYGCWYMVMRYPDRFAASVPMSGGAAVNRAGAVAAVPTWCFHGDADNTVPVSGSREMVAAMDSCRGGDAVRFTCAYKRCTAITPAGLDPVLLTDPDLIYTEYAGGGHVIWSSSYNGTYLTTWMFSKTREVSGVTNVPAPAGAAAARGRVTVLQGMDGMVTFKARLDTPDRAVLTVFNTAGKIIAAPAAGRERKRNIQWNTRIAAPGIFLYRCRVGGGTEYTGTFFVR